MRGKGKTLNVNSSPQSPINKQRRGKRMHSTSALLQGTKKNGAKKHRILKPSHIHVGGKLIIATNNIEKMFTVVKKVSDIKDDDKEISLCQARDYVSGGMGVRFIEA